MTWTYNELHYLYTLKNSWVVSTQIWVKYGQTQMLKKLQLKVKAEFGLIFEITFLTQHLGLSIFDPNLGSNNPALFRVY